MSDAPDLTRQLRQLRNGSTASRDRLLASIYDELRRIAHGHLARRRPGQTLNTTALVHEVYLKLIDQTQAQWQDRAHFFATASRAMRYILIDYIKHRTAQKRGGGQAPLPLDDLQIAGDDARTPDLLDLHDALDRLAVVDERLGRLVEYRFFGGLDFKEIAEVTGRSERTIRRDWKKARLFLYRAMTEDDAPPA